MFKSDDRYEKLIDLVLDEAEQCTDENFLYYLVSGLHASVNTHIS